MGSNYLYYAVNIGRKKGVYTSWEECRNQVHGYPYAKYKGYMNIKEAEEFVNWPFYAVKSERKVFRRDDYIDWDAYWKKVENFLDGDRQGFDTEEEAKHFIGNTFYAIKIEGEKGIYYDLDDIKEKIQYQKVELEIQYPKVELHTYDNKKDAEKFLDWPFYAVKSKKEIFKKEDYADWDAYWKEVENFTDKDRKGFDEEEVAEQFIDRKYYVINSGPKKGLYESIEKYYEVMYDAYKGKDEKQENIDDQKREDNEFKDSFYKDSGKYYWEFSDKDQAENFLEGKEVEESTYQRGLIEDAIKKEE